MPFKVSHVQLTFMLAYYESGSHLGPSFTSEFIHAKVVHKVEATGQHKVVFQSDGSPLRVLYDDLFAYEFKKSRSRVSETPYMIFDLFGGGFQDFLIRSEREKVLSTGHYI